MKALAIVVLIPLAAVAADVPLSRVADDAKAIDTIAAASKHDLPRDLLRRIINEDIELLRGRRMDGGYDFASYERLEAGRSTDSFSVEASDGEKLTKLETKGSFVYRLLIESPSRRMLVTKNRRVFVDRAEIEFIPVRGGATNTQTVKIQAWLEPGSSRTIDLDDIARQATARVYARTEKDAGYGNLTLSLIRARVSDNADSPYADAIASAKAILRALDHDDVSSMRAMAQRMANDVQPTVAAAVAAAPKATQADTDYVNELQAIEDLLTGNDNERRQGLDRLHQLIRKLRPNTTTH